MIEIIYEKINVFEVLSWKEILLMVLAMIAIFWIAFCQQFVFSLAKTKGWATSTKYLILFGTIFILPFILLLELLGGEEIV